MHNIKLTSFRKNAHAVIIGIDKYKDARIPNLQFANADARGIYDILTDSELGRIHPDNVILLLDEEASQVNIRTAISHEIPRRADAKDMVIIYYAGHGAPLIDPKSPSPDGMEKYLIPADANLDTLRATAISMGDIQRFFAWIESNQIVFFIDSCYSGEAGGRTFQQPYYQTRHLQLTNDFLDNVAGEGRLVVTACGVNEVSMETEELGHGLFTYYLMQGLKGAADTDGDGLVTDRELYDYIFENVSRKARMMGGSMHPILKGAIVGKIYLSQYETEVQKQVNLLLARAESSLTAGQLHDAYACYRHVLKLDPSQEQAKQKIIKIERIRQEEKRQQQLALERKQAFLLDLYETGKLPALEYNFAMNIITKKVAELSERDGKIFKLVEDLVAGKIAVAIYLSSVTLIRKTQNTTAIPKPTPVLKKTASEAKDRVETIQVTGSQHVLKTPASEASQKSDSPGAIIVRKRARRIIAYCSIAIIMAIIVTAVYISLANRGADQINDSNSQEIAPDVPAETGITSSGQSDTAPESHTFKVNFSISPEGADIFLDAEKIGTSPLALIEKTKGQYRIAISKAGYKTYSSSIYIKSDTLISQRLERSSPLQPSVGTLFVTSEPDNPQVFIDNRRYGALPIRDLPAGQHTLKLQKQGYSDTVTTFMIREGKETRLYMKLQPLLGEISILVLPFGDIFVDNRLVMKEVDTWHTLTLQTGPHSIRIEHPSSRRTWQKIMVIKQNETQRRVIDFNKKIDVEIGATGMEPGWGYIYIDGKNTGKETPAKITLSVGLYAIAVRHDRLNLWSEEKTALIDEGENVKFIFNLAQKK
ncbi:PEGA domain-containing protein [candidate division KSB1 bacterium]|nr:PEGA domain-containing protein [candidate division KSB1 bacterium]